METKVFSKALNTVIKDCKDKTAYFYTTAGSLCVKYTGKDGEMAETVLIKCDKAISISLNLKQFARLLTTLDDTFQIEYKTGDIEYNAYDKYVTGSTYKINRDHLYITSGTSKITLEAQICFWQNFETVVETVPEAQETAVVIPQETAVETVVVETKVETQETTKTIDTDSLMETIISDANKIKQSCKNIKVELIGAWLWITGDTYTNKETIKESGFKWSSNKKAWYKPYKPCSSRRRYSLVEIKSRYEAVEI